VGDSLGRFYRALRVLGILGLASLSTAALAAPPTLDATSQGTTNMSDGTTSLSWSHTTGSGSNRFLLVGVAVLGDTSVSSVTYNGKALTSIGEQVAPPSPTPPPSGGSSVRVEQWGMVAPDTGPFLVQVTLSASTRAVGFSASFSDVDQSSPHGTFASTQGSIPSPMGTASVNVTAAADDVVVDTLVVQDSGDSSPPAVAPMSGQTGLSTITGGMTTPPNNIRGAGSTKAGAATVTMSWTVGAIGGTATWALGGVPVMGVLPSSTPTDTATQTATGTVTDTPTATQTPTATATATDTGTVTDTPTVTQTPTATATATGTATSSQTATSTDTRTGTATPTATATGTTTHTATVTSTATATRTATTTPTVTSTGTVTNTATVTPTATPAPNGAACKTPTDCVSGNCVDHTCCAEPSCPPGQSCDNPGYAGECSQTLTAPAPALSRGGVVAAAVLLLGLGGVAVRRRRRGP